MSSTVVIHINLCTVQYVQYTPYCTVLYSTYMLNYNVQYSKFLKYPRFDSKPHFLTFSFGSESFGLKSGMNGVYNYLNLKNENITIRKPRRPTV